MKYLFTLSALLLCLFFTACNNNEADQGLEEAEADMEEMLPEADEVNDAQLADYNWLKKYLPSQVGDKQMSKSEAELTNMMGYEISRAEAGYGSFNMTKISIADVSKAGAELGRLGDWIENDLDEVDSKSFERTSLTNNAYRTLEKYDAESKTATVSVLVGDRYLITATSEDDDHDMADLKAAIQSMALDQLAGEERYSQVGQ